MNELVQLVRSLDKPTALELQLADALEAELATARKDALEQIETRLYRLAASRGWELGTLNQIVSEIRALAQKESG